MRFAPAEETQCNRGSRDEVGFTLLELMVAALVLAVGLTGGLSLVITAVANNYRDKTDSTSTVISQMTVEMLSSISANSTSTVFITDCNPSSGSATHTLNTGNGTVGSSAGASLNSSGNIDFTASAVSGYSMTFYSCQASTGDRQTLYDVRWNVKTLTKNTKLVTVSAREAATTGRTNLFATPVSLKAIVGL